MEFKDCLTKYCTQVGVELDETQVEKFDTYFQMMIEKNKVMNLTAITDVKDVVLKHMLDCLLVYEADVFSENSSICDLGTGAGFPGMPLKIYKPSLNVTLMDSLGKRLKWLDEVVDTLSLKKIGTCHMRAEDAGNNKAHREKYDLVLSRAVARLSVLAEYCLPLVKTGGCFVAMKASNYEQELEEAKNALQILGGEVVKVKHVQLPEIDDKRVVIYIKKVHNTPKAYPRRAGVPDKSSL